MSGMGMMGPAWRSLRSDRSVVNETIDRRTVRRVLGFARPHRRLIAVFLALTVIDACLVVVTPLLVQRIVDDGILKGDDTLVTVLALGMAAVAARRRRARRSARGYLSSRIGEGLIFDLRTRVFGHVQRQSLAFFTRTQTGALVSRLNNDVIGAQRAFTSTLSSTVSSTDLGGRRRHRDVRAELAGHPALPGALPAAAAHLAVGERPAGRADPPADGRQRRHGQRDDRAVQRRRRDAAQALRPPRRGGRAVRRQGGDRARPRRPDLADHPHLRRLDDAGPGARDRARVRRRRPPRHRRHPHRRHPARARHPAAAAARAAAGPLQRPDRRDDRAGQLRAGLRGARPALDDPGEAGRGRAAAVGGPARVRPRRVHLPARRRDLAGLARVGRAHRVPRHRPGAGRHLVRRPSPARWSRWSARPAPARRRSPTWSPGSTTSAPARSGSAATTYAT